MERTGSCPSCGRGVFHGDAFCSSCGTPIQPRSTDTGKARQTLARQTIPTGDRQTCASCNSPILPGDVFCSTCGARYGVDPTEGAFEDVGTSIPRRISEASRGKYELIRELGRGGMGIVFMARDRELERLVAIKVLSPSLLADEAMVKRFQREARTIASLRHESIVSIYDVGRTGKLHYFVMDFIEGVSLSRILRTHGPLPIPLVEAVLYQVGSALAYAHRPGRGIVHRDVKPSNIMLDAEGLAVVMDFGISKVSEAAGGLTRTGLVIGTPEYMSPEQCRGHTVTHDSDQYSLGTVVFAMLTGAPPFTGPFYRVLMAHQSEPVPSVRELRPDCPPELAEATEKMLGKVPGERWPSIKDALKALGLRPLAPDEPALRELGELVRSTTSLDRRKEGEGGPAGGASGDGGGPRTPTSIRIVPVPGDLELGDELGLRASALFPDGVEETGMDVSWESTDPGIVRVDPSTGQLEAVGVGSAFVTAQGAGLTGSVAVEVKAPQVVRVVIQPGDARVEVGSTLELRAEPRDKRDRVLERGVSWSSSDPRTATVTRDGRVTGQRAGTATILAHAEGVGAAAAVEVVEGSSGTGDAAAGPPTRIARIDVSNPPGGLRVSHTFRLVATPLDEDDRPVNEAVRWTVEDPSVLEALGDGRFRAVGSGTGTVMAEAGEARTRVRVSVAADRAAADRAAEPVVGPTPAPRSGAAGGRPGNDRDGEGIPVTRPGAGEGEKAASWGGPPTRTVALWASLAVAAGAGALWLGRGLLGGTGPVPVAEVTILSEGEPVDAGLSLAVGDSLLLGATPSDADGTTLQRAVAWSSGDPAVASVDGDGLLVARAGGSTRVTATAEGVVREVPVTVEAPPFEIVLRTAADGRPVDGPLDLEVGESVDLDATVLDVSGGAVPGAEVTWTADPPSVAAVDAGGTVSARGGGRALVTARAGDLEAEIPVEVEEPPPPPPAMGTLLVTINPSWAYLIVDGVRRGEPAQTHNLSLSPGEHSLRLENQNMMPLDTTFTIRPGATTRLQLLMRQRNEG